MIKFQRILWASESGGILETTIIGEMTTSIGQKYITHKEIKDMVFQGIIDRHFIAWQKLAAI